jgi:hypothetical protein
MTGFAGCGLTEPNGQSPFCFFFLQEKEDSCPCRARGGTSIL